MKFKTVIGKTVELTAERKNYILAKHPELKPHFNKIRNVLIKPDEIRRSKRNQQVLLFYKYFAKILGGKYIVVVTKFDTRNFVITAHITDKIKIGKKYEEKS